jgi:type II secretory pathway pseudopilin PulG
MLKKEILRRLLSVIPTQRQQGFGLAETLVAVAVLGTSVVAFVVALSTGSLTVNEQDTETRAQCLAQSQMEYIKGYPYAPGASTYPAALAAPADYSVSVNVSSVPGADANVQKITVSVLRGSQNVFTVSDYKVNR